MSTLTICQYCKSAELELPPDEHPSYLLCPSCKAIQLTYEPMPHQAAFHRDGHKYKGFFGGYGSAKTRTTVEEMKMVGLENPGCQAVMTAPTLPQLRETSMSMFFKEVIPPPLIKDHHKQENKTVLINGFEYLWRPSNDPGNLRSLNLCAFHMEEASEINYDIYDQLTTRLRDTKANYYRGLLSSNPDENWIKGKFLQYAGSIVGDSYIQNPEEIDKNIAVHIAPTKLNYHLPSDFEEGLRKNKPDWWIERYLEGSFRNREGKVYANFDKCIIDPFEIPPHWEIRLGIDHGIRNPTAVAFIAINPMVTQDDLRKPKLVLFDEYYVPNQLTPFHVKAIKRKLAEFQVGRITVMRIDPSTKNRDAFQGKNVQAYYIEHGLFVTPANNSLDFGLLKVNTYLESGHFKIFRTCVNAIAEGVAYKYPEQKLEEEKNLDEKPRKYKDHLMDGIRYVIVDLPDDPETFMNFSYEPGYIAGNKYIWTVGADGELLKHQLPHALQTDDDDYDDYGGGDWTSYV